MLHSFNFFFKKKIKNSIQLRILQTSSLKLEVVMLLSSCMFSAMMCVNVKVH